jgi:hypothetical protein
MLPLGERLRRLSPRISSLRRSFLRPAGL